MLYLIAFIGAITTGVLLWKAFGPDSGAVPQRPMSAPDDDPDFLRGLGKGDPDKDL